jgi:hypothetical protein
MTNMIERVARAMAEADGWPSLEIARRTLGGENSCDFDLCARAAIAAMREPTDAMYMAGGIVSPSAHLADKDYKPYGTRTIGDMAAKAAWVKMIDAALEEK